MNQTRNFKCGSISINVIWLVRWIQCICHYHRYKCPYLVLSNSFVKGACLFWKPIYLSMKLRCISNFPPRKTKTFENTWRVGATAKILRIWMPCSCVTSMYLSTPLSILVASKDGKIMDILIFDGYFHPWVTYMNAFIMRVP